MENYLQADGRLPAFLHAHWLAAGLWFQLGWTAAVARVLPYLYTRLPELPASSLAWLVTSLCISGVPASKPTVSMAAAHLAGQQQADGRWQSEDGPERDVQATLEALRALRLCSLI